MVVSAALKQGRSANHKHTYFFFLALGETRQIFAAGFTLPLAIVAICY